MTTLILLYVCYQVRCSDVMLIETIFPALFFFVLLEASVLILRQSETHITSTGQITDTHSRSLSTGTGQITDTHSRFVRTNVFQICNLVPGMI